MCGIAGTYHQSINLSPQENSLDLSPILHRGPDAQKIYNDKNCILGATRLNILDPSGGKQPFIFNNRFVLIFNGQIYNHLLLRKKIRNVLWNTHSDTETVIHLLINYGPTILAELEGMFALAFYDNKQEQLIIARDKIGEKPLYYYKEANTLTFGSSVDVVSKNIKNVLDIDFSAMKLMLDIGFIPPNRSIFEKIKPVMPGQYLKINKVSHEVTSYGKKINTKIDCEKPSKFLLDLIQDSVNDQSNADVDVGLFLSGGLDSSILAYSMKERLGKFKSFCIDYGENKDDINSAIRITKELSTELIIVKLNDDISGLVENNAYFFDEPFGDSASIPLNALSAAAKNEVGVCLSGDGADELFGGYDFRYRALTLKPSQSYFLDNNLLTELVLKVMNKIGFKELRKSYNYRNQSFSYSKSDNILKTFIEFNYNLTYRRGFLDELGYENFSDQSEDGDTLSRILKFEENFYLLGDILVKTDRATMAHSLEARTPYLNSRIIEFANALDSNEKISPIDSKKILYQVFQDKTGKQFHRKEKMGMGLPVKYWMQSNQIQRVYASLKQKKFYKEICGKFGQKYFEQNSKSYPQYDWNLFNLLSWAEAKGKND